MLGFFLAGDTRSPEKWVLISAALSQHNESWQPEKRSRKGVLTVFNTAIPLKWQTPSHWDNSMIGLYKIFKFFLQENMR